MALVLCTGRDGILTKTRLLILEADGHTVVSAQDESTLIDVCRKHAFEVAVIGQTASEQEKQKFFSLIRTHHPRCKILELHSTAAAPVLRKADGWLEVPAITPGELAERVGALCTARQGKAKSSKPIKPFNKFSA